MQSHIRENVPHGRRGLSIIEVMISLTISAFLLVAVAAAYSASADAVEMNDKFFRATQAGRVTMNQLLTEIRRADSIQVFTDHIDVIRPVAGATGGTGTRLPKETYRTFSYDPMAKQVNLQIHYDATAPAPLSPLYPLARNVEATLFGPAEIQKDANNADIVTRVPVQIVVRIGGNEVRLSGASGPRRAAKE
jgi:prepilin-type N-terminal cleavage/methylation domain-containing protein